MGIARTPAPHVIKSSKIVNFVGEREIAAVFRAADPLGIDDRCEFNANGLHQAVGSCSDIVCCYCAKIFWS